MSHTPRTVPGWTRLPLDLQHAGVGQLATLFQLDAAEQEWDVADLSVLWRQQLATGIVDELSRDGFGPEGLLRSLCASATPSIVSFGHLITVSAPPADLLGLVRRWAKRQIGALQTVGLDSVPRALYYATVASGMRAGHAHATSLSKAQLQVSLAWVSALPWLDETTRRLCQGLSLRIGR